ncbi:DUF4240 domain-containing protein [Streptomyces fradiae]|uniref:DUF4240 domain-containing protein n=1 Tax=Streptomyces fradiae TaxID=1906 RepID=UPI0029438345|nr:DUF4240 domain-containing protein [Streptomyces fradiae]WOI61967.1 DUF4240 domain-containing protein [Streptomyces fradiae]
MEDKAFWALMDELSSRPGDRQERLEWLRGRLRCRPAAEGLEFQARLDAACAAVATGALWRAVGRIEGGLCSDDGFDYFALWLVAQGQGTYEAVLADPDALADIAEVRALVGRHPRGWRDDEWPEWEELDYVAPEILGELTGQEIDCGETFYEIPDAAQETCIKPERRSDIREATVRAETPRIDALFPVRTGSCSVTRRRRPRP